MIGRVEVTEILGMVGTCAAVLVAGVFVQTLEGEVRPAWAVSGADIEAPEVPAALALPEEISLEKPELDHPSFPQPSPIVLMLPESCLGPCECVVKRES